jgi:hypothetical protein
MVTPTNMSLPCFTRRDFRQFLFSTIGLPDGVFAYQKTKFWFIFEGLEMKKSGIFLLSVGNLHKGHVVYFLVILVFILPFWYVVRRKIWQP